MTNFGGFIDTLEERVLAAILGIMTVITFANVITRYVFNFNILWALEVTVFLFAWLVILGASYALKKSAHLGVDVLINAVTAATRRLIGLVAGAAVVAFSLLMFKGAWDFWANFAELPQTEGRWFPLGFEDSFRGKGWYETTSTPIPDFMRVLEAWFNAGEPYEKMPRVIPYLVLPLGMGLLLLRSLQALWRIWCGDIDRLIAGHEAEDEVENAANAIEGEK
ncbi:TRAP transporter small permease [Roseibium sp.]|uniref:TRAP transporter small permease n=1 Tax=Roseibium sp. TaxID=1936156 RepID=UPI00260F147F|nr:TRAP transporter small permease [Roseibium sp.]